MMTSLPSLATSSNKGMTEPSSSNDSAGPNQSAATVVATDVALPTALATMLESARQTILMMRYRRVLWYLPIALLVLGGLTFLLASRAQGRISGHDLYSVIAWWGLGTVIVPWVTLFLGVQAVHGEIEDRTSQYLLLRPVRRVPLLIGKWLAITVTNSVLAMGASAVLFAAIAARPGLWENGYELHLLWSFALVLSLGAMAYAAVAVFFGATFRRPLAWAAFFVVGLQMLTANLPVSAGLRQVTITDHLRRMVLDLVEPDRSLARALWPAERAESLVGLSPGAFRFESGSPLVSLLIFTGVCLLLGCYRYAKTEYESRARD